MRAFKSPCRHTDVRQAVPLVTDPGSKLLTTPPPYRCPEGVRRIANLTKPTVHRLSPPSRAARLRSSVPELLDAVVATVGHIDVTGRVDCHTKGRDKLPVATTRATPPGNEITTGGELLDAVVATVGHIN